MDNCCHSRTTDECSLVPRRLSFEFERLLSDVEKNVLYPVINRQVRQYIRDEMDDYEGLEDALEEFFFAIETDVRVKRRTYNRNSESPTKLEETLNRWQKGVGNPPFVLATYYWFHVYAKSKFYASRIDHEIFVDEVTGEGEPFEEKFGFPVPRGVEIDSEHPAEADQPKSTELSEASPQSKLEERQRLQPLLTPPRQTGKAYHFATPHMQVLGRDEEQETLRAFRDSGNGFRWMQLAGAGGQGKSRLAYDLIKESAKNWAAGFLSADDLADFADQWSHWMPDRPHLMVVDYVIGVEATLKPAMQMLAKRRNEFEVPVCLLLVERQPWSDGEIGTQLAAGDSETGTQLAAGDRRALGASLFSPTADWYRKLTDKGDGLDHGLDKARSEIDLVLLKNLNPDRLVDIVWRFDKAHRITATYAEIKSHLDNIDKSGRPLYAYFLAQALIDGGHRPDWAAADLLSWVLEHESNTRWKDKFGEAPPRSGDDPPKLDGETDGNPAMRIALIAAMVDGLHCDNFPLEDGWSHPNSTIRHQALFLADAAIPGATPPMEIPARQPDLLGDWFVLSSIRFGVPVTWLAETAWRLAPDKMVIFLQRIARDFPSFPATKALLDHTPAEDAGVSAYAAVGTPLLLTFNSSNEGVPAGVIRALRWAVDRGDGAAMANLGVCYERGIGVEKDIGTAVDFHRRGVGAMNGRAQNNLGQCYQYGIGVEKDIETAIDLYRQGVEAKDGAAMANLGTCYEQGVGVEKDLETAVDLYRQGVEAKDGMSMANLGVCYQQGIGVGQELETAIELFHMGAKAGSKIADMRLVVLQKVGMIAPTQGQTSKAIVDVSVHSTHGPWCDDPPFPADWNTVCLSDTGGILQKIARSTAEEFGEDYLVGAIITGMRRTTLPFYPGFQLVDLQFEKDHMSTPRLISALITDHGAVLLDENSTRIHALNDLVISLDSHETLLSYLYFFCFFARGPFEIVQRPEDIPFSDEMPLEEREAIVKFVHPPRILVFPPSEDDSFQINACVLYSGALFSFVIETSKSGMVDVIGLEHLAGSLHAITIKQNTLYSFYRKISFWVLPFFGVKRYVKLLFRRPTYQSVFRLPPR